MVYVILSFLIAIFVTCVFCWMVILPEIRRDAERIREIKDAKELKVRQEMEARDGEM